MHFYLEPEDATRYEIFIDTTLKNATPCFLVATQFSKLRTIPQPLLEKCEKEILSADRQIWQSNYLVEEITRETDNPFTSRAILIACLFHGGYILKLTESDLWPDYDKIVHLKKKEYEIQKETTKC